MLKLTKELDKKFKSAVSVLENDDKFRIITHYDADGISAASVLALTMMKAQKGFHVRFVEKVPEKIPTSLPLIFTDIGNSHLKRISEQEVPVIILDHHYVPDNINGERDDHVYINPHDLGIDGAREVSGGTLSLILSTVYDDINWDLAIYGLSGAAADKQNINGFVGLNSDILKEAIKREKILVKEGLYIDGDNIKDALMKACDPYFPTISGREDRIDELLKKIGI
ncbi:MAG: DHH family phosphoesterase, partial [Thermoplasmatota archaeon]